jgi:predicted SAM-dependent methyltransferase
VRRQSVRLNLGCGNFPAAGWVNVDSFSDSGADVIASLDSLPFTDGSAEMVYAGHVLEHVAPKDLSVVLREIRRVLTVDGQFCAVGPDLDRIDGKADPSLYRDALHGGHRWPGDEHRWGCTETLLLTYIRDVFPHAVPLLVADVPEPWPVTTRVEAWQCAVRA